MASDPDGTCRRRPSRSGLRVRRLRPRPRRPRAQPQERRRRHPARRAGRLHRRLRLGQVVARLRHALRRGPAALPRVGRARTPAGCSTRSACRRSTRSTACRRPSPSSSSAARRPPARRSAASPRSRTCCGCSTRAPATTRRARRILYAESFSPNTPEGACPSCHGLGRVYDVTERVDGARRLADDPRAGDRRLAAGVARAEPARHPHRRSATTSTRPGATCRRRTATGSCSPTSSRTVPVYAGYDRRRGAAGA